MNNEELQKIEDIIKKLEGLGDSPSWFQDVDWCIANLKALIIEHKFKQIIKKEV